MDKPLPEWLDDNTLGHIIWSVIFCYAVIFPLAMARKISALKYSSYFSFFCGMYVVLVICLTCLTNRKVNPDLKESLRVATTEVNISVTGIFNSFPLIVFSFMYQPNLPAVYQELETKTMSRMWRVVFYATSIAVVCYAFAGFFGYATFANNDDIDAIMKKENIFEAPYGSDSWIIAGSLILLAGVILASPLCLMPAKDTIEELFLG